MDRRATRRKLAIGLGGLLLASSAIVLCAQELSTFLARLPPPGAWARYRVETRKPDFLRKRPFDLAVLEGRVLDGKPYVWLEAGPTKFAGFNHGYLRILIKAHPSEEEALNPFLSALALAYQEPEKEPFLLSEGALSFLHGSARDVSIKRLKETLPPGKAVSIKGRVFDCTRLRLTTTTETSFFTRRYKVVETGTYWFSPETPFRIVKAEISRVETRKGKEIRKDITCTVKEASFHGAKTHFSKPATRKKSILGILFH